MTIHENINEYEAFLSKACNQSEFVVRVSDIRTGSSCMVELYDLIDDERPVFIEVNLICKIDVWGKYYFPEFNPTPQQWYHEMGPNEDRIQAVADAMKFALKLGLKRAEIKPY
jgi:hypothetical protein